MSDTVKKYFEMVEDGLITESTPPNDYLSWRLRAEDPEVRQEAYTLLTMYSEAAILKAAEILKRDA